MAVRASPLILPYTPDDTSSFKDERSAFTLHLLGRDVNVTTWRSMRLEGSPLEPVEPLSHIINIENIIGRTVYDPPITYPDSGTVWTAGKVVEVKWKVKQEDIPPNAKNYKAKVMLGYLPYGSSTNEHLKWTLAEHFSITDESISFRLPSDLATRSDYIIVLFGDSGNRSERFTIKAKDAVDQETKRPSASKNTPKQLSANKEVDTDTAETSSPETIEEKSPVKTLLSNVLRSLPGLSPPPRPCRICLP